MRPTDSSYIIHTSPPVSLLLGSDSIQVNSVSKRIVHCSSTVKWLKSQHILQRIQTNYHRHRRSAIKTVHYSFRSRWEIWNVLFTPHNITFNSIHRLMRIWRGHSQHDAKHADCHEKFKVPNNLSYCYVPNIVTYATTVSRAQCKKKSIYMKICPPKQTTL